MMTVRVRRVFTLALLCVFPAIAEIRPLTILHTNDLHARLSPLENGHGGFAYLASLIRRERSGCPQCILLNAGDLVQGTPVSTIFHGLPVFQVANLLGFDAATLGNHEFDYGWRRIPEFIRIAHFPIVSANVVDASGKLLTGQAYAIKTVGGIRVAVIGALLGDMVGTVTTAEAAGPWHVLPVVETVRKYAQELRPRSDLIVVLGHIHDKEEAEAILKDVPEVSVVVAGHTHVAYPSMMNFGGRVGVLVDAYGREYGRLDLQVDMAGKKLRSAEWKKIPVDDKIRPDPQVAKLVAEWEAKVTKLVDQPIGESRQRLAQRSPELRSLVEQAMAEQTGSDIGWVNFGNLRDVLPEGRILARNIWNILPFDNYIVIGKFKGSQLPPAITERYKVQPDREYTVATTDFTAANQAAPDQLHVSGLKFPRTGPLQRDAVIDWIKKKRVVP